MSNVIYVLNAASVGVFGILLSASFCELDWTPARRRALAASSVLLLALQDFFYLTSSGSTVKALYPFITHLPLFLLLFAGGIPHNISEHQH